MTLQLHQFTQRLPYVVGRDRVPVHVQLVEDRLVELTAPRILNTPVQLVRMFQQVDCGVQDGGPRFEFNVDRLHLLMERLPLLFDLEESAPNLLPSRRRLRREVDQVRFLRVQPFKLRAQLLVQQLDGLVLTRQGLADVSAHLGDQLGCEGQRLVVLGYGGLDGEHVQEGLVTLVFLLAAAEEVEVLPAVALGPLQDHAPFAPLHVARTAPEASLQVVVPRALPLTTEAAALEHQLDALEQLAADQGFVASAVLLAVVHDDAEVVLVS